MISRRSALALPLGLAMADAACVRAARAATSPGQALAFVMNSAGGSVSIIDMKARRLLREEPTFREPSHWALTPDRRTLLVCDAGGNGLFRFDPVTGAPLGHQRMADPYQIGFTPDNRYFVANALRLDFVDVYEAATLKLVKRFSVGLWPSHLGFSPDSRWSFHSMQNSNSLVSLDLVSMTERWSIKPGETPAGVLWHRGKVLCCIAGGRGFVEVDPVDGRILREVVTGDGAHNIFLDTVRQVLYVSNRGPGRTGLTALDPVTFELRHTYPIDGGPDDIAIDPAGNIWIAVRFAEKVAVLNPISGEMTSITVGRSPHGIFLNTMLSNQDRVTAEQI